jgi:RNA methyltransferase, TrmH family
MTELVHRFRAARRDPALAVLEGLHALKHALRFGAEPLVVVAAAPERVRRLAAALAPDVARRLEAITTTVDGATFAALAPFPPPTGILALALRPAVDVAGLLAAPGDAPVVLLEAPSDLGNIGAVVRVAAAAGAAGVLTTGRHDPWHPVALRGAAGLHYALPVARVDELPGGRPIVAIAPGGEPLRPGLIPARAVLALGTERGGLSAALLARAELRVGIPMRAGVSSLNLATAAAVALYAGITG